MAATPWLTTNGLIESVKRKIAVPISQVTFNESDIIRFLNEEMFIAQVPTVLSYHEEFYVYRVPVPFKGSRSRYQIPNRTIGMKVRDIAFLDDNQNIYEMTRINAEDKAFFQVNLGISAITAKYYIEGNEIVLTPANISNQSGTLMFYIYLRPNQLVKDSRAAICQAFQKQITINSSVMLDGDVIVINDIIMTARTGSPGANEFQIDPSSVITAGNLAALITSLGIASSTNGNPVTNVVTSTYNNHDFIYSTNNAQAFAISTKTGVKFNALPTTWLNEDTRLIEPLFVENVLIDFLQTKPGHSIYKYDINIDTGALNSGGAIIQFNDTDIPDNFIVGDYICLANECIIPQIPPDLHNVMAERACARILSSLGDQQGLAMINQKIQEMEQKQGNLLDNRVDGSIEKINGRHSLLRYQGIGSRRRF